MSVPAGVNRSGRSGQVDLGGLIAVPGTAGIGAKASSEAHWQAERRMRCYKSDAKIAILIDDNAL